MCSTRLKALRVIDQLYVLGQRVLTCDLLLPVHLNDVPFLEVVEPG